jgi:NADH-quinone oxidoreductase subunit C/D
MNADAAGTVYPSAGPEIAQALAERLGMTDLLSQSTADGITTLWLPREKLRPVLGSLKHELLAPYVMLFDLAAVDERWRTHRQGLPDCDFTVVYHLLSFSRNEDIRLKVALRENDLHLPTVSDLWPSANWYEREAWDMFGIVFEGHPHLRRILMPQTWQGHPLRKDHYARATEMEPFSLS